jgi:hypothetical protein
MAIANYNNVPIVGMTDINGRTLTTVGAFGIAGGSANCIIPARFRILLQNMDAVNSLTFTNSSLYFS